MPLMPATCAASLQSAVTYWTCLNLPADLRRPLAKRLLEP